MFSPGCNPGGKGGGGGRGWGENLKLCLEFAAKLRADLSVSIGQGESLTDFTDFRQSEHQTIF